MILALSISLLLLGALYVALQILMSSTDTGRSLVTEANVSRGVFNKITSDINSNLTPLDPRFNNAINLPDGTNTPIGAAAAAANSSSSGTTSSGTSGTTSGSGSGSGTGGGSSSGTGGGSGSSSGSSNTTPPAPAGTPVTFNLMVQGDSSCLTLYLVTVPRAPLDALKATAAADGTDMPLPVADLRRISYCLIDGKGLARQEIKMVTDVNSVATLPPSLSTDDPGTTIVGEGVTSVQFQYWDGMEWQDSWDGTMLSSIDMVTPQGPPMAIAVTITMKRPGNMGDRTYKHVVAIPTANNGIASATTTSGS